MSYFDSGSKAGFGIFVIALFFFPVGQYECRSLYSFRYKAELGSEIFLFLLFLLKQ